MPSLIGNKPNQVPSNGDLGTMAFQDANAVNITGGVVGVSAGTAALPTLGTTGDENTGVFFPAADTVAVSTNGTERMRIDSSGNVGIGTSSPQSKFVVSNAGAGGIEMLTDGTIQSYNRSTSAYQGLRLDGSVLLFRPSGTEAMRIDSSGNVGIGTSSPANRLHVVADNTAFRGQLSLQTSSASNFSQITFYDQTTLSSQIFQGYPAGDLTISNVTNAGIILSANNAERMRIDSSGNLLVGTTSSSGKTTIDAGSATGLFVKNTGEATYTPLYLWNATTTGDGYFAVFATETSQTFRGSIIYNRAGGLVAYNTTSDYRAKDIIGSVSNSGDVIDSVPVYMGKMKGATQARPMFIAHETPDYAHTGEKDAVDKDGNPVYQQMDASSLVPVLWAEIQSLRKRVAQLESK